MGLHPRGVFPPFCCEIRASGEQVLLETMRRQTNSREFATDGTAKLNYLQSFFDVQFSWLAMRIHAAVIVDAISKVRILLHLAQNHSGTNRVRCAGRHKKCVSRLYAPMNEDVFQPLRFDGLQKYLFVRLWYQSEKNSRSWFRRDGVPHFGFSAAAGGFFVDGGIRVAGMHLDRKLVRRK